MSIEETKKILSSKGLEVTKHSEGVHWVLKMDGDKLPLLPQGVEALKEAGYTIVESGGVGDISYVRLINPAHAEHKPNSWKEPAPEPEPEPELEPIEEEVSEEEYEIVPPEEEVKPNPPPQAEAKGLDDAIDKL